MNVLFVCTGNICRSPFAEAVARRVAERRGLDGIVFASAGTDVALAAPPAEAVAAAREHGVDLTSFASRQLTPELAAEADAVVVMAEHHLEDPVVASASERAAVFAAGAIRDPYGLGAAAYRRTYDEIVRAVEGLLDEVEAGART